MKYTIEEFKKGDKAVKIENEEQWNKLNKVHKLTSRFRGNYYYSNKETFWSTSSKSELEDYNIEVLQFSQLVFKDDFIVGCWYKNLGSQKGHIGKFEGFLYDYPLTMSVSEYIYNGELKGGEINFTSDYKYAEVCLISEIKQYLPEGHVDLIEKEVFVLPEKWFIRTTPETRVILVKWRGGDYSGFEDESVLISDQYWIYVKHVTPEYKEITFEQFVKYVLKQENTMNTFELPKYWYIVVTEENKDILSNWRFKDKNFKLNIGTIVGTCSKYPDEKCHNYNKDEDWKDSIEITFEQFKTNVLKENTMNTFGLKIGDNLPKEIISKWEKMNLNRYVHEWENGSAGFCSDRTIVSFEIHEGIPAFLVSNTVDVYLKCEGFLEFKNNNMKKMVIGYKLIKPQYREAALQIVPNSVYLKTGISKSGCSYIDINVGTTYKLLKQAGVLDLWFEEVYVEDPKLPKIDEHQGLVTGGTLVNTHLKWGCTEISIDVIKHLLKLEVTKIELKGVTINSNQINTIEKFIEYHKL